MGVYRSCPLAVHCDTENGFESIILKSINLGDDEKSRAVQTICFKDTEASANGMYMSDEMVSPLPISYSLMGRIQEFPVFDPSSPRHEAAIKLQKVYKSFRTRRKLADCAVLIEQSWWKLLDFAELKHSSISFFDLDKHETAISRWSRARTRAAKVGKGLSKNGKAQKLALQHWLEAIDPRHRYGHNLHFYYVKWLNSQSKEPFFYWLDIGEGKDVNLTEKCPRSKLQQQCIKYLGPMERKAYEVMVEDGKLVYKQTGELLDTTKEPRGSKWIFVLSTSKTLYVGKKKKGTFQHSSFLAGGAALAAGRIVAEKGVLKAVWPHSGHYRPTPENFQDFLSFLRENTLDLTDVKLDCTDEEEGSLYLRGNASEGELAERDRSQTEDNNIESSCDKIISREEDAAAAMQTPRSRVSHCFSRKLTALEIPSKENLVEKLMSENRIAESSFNISPPESPMDVDETTEKSNSMSLEGDETQEEAITEESIFQRINSHKETKSFQLGKQLSSKWTTGAGPRIGWVRDYPSWLQSQALEQTNLSPRSKHRLKLEPSSRAESTRSGSNLSCRSSYSSPMQFSPINRLTEC